jgi:hypothetical protein
MERDLEGLRVGVGAGRDRALNALGRSVSIPFKTGSGTVQMTTSASIAVSEPRL